MNLLCLHCDENAVDACAGCGRYICQNHGYFEKGPLGQQIICVPCGFDPVISPDCNCGKVKRHGKSSTR